MPLKKQLVSTGINNLEIPTDISTATQKYITRKVVQKIGKGYYTNDQLFDMLPDLVNQQFRAWYCERFYALGHQRVLELASVARSDGKEPRKLFSFLIKE